MRMEEFAIVLAVVLSVFTGAGFILGMLDHLNERELENSCKSSCRSHGYPEFEISIEGTCFCLDGEPFFLEENR